MPRRRDFGTRRGLRTRRTFGVRRRYRGGGPGSRLSPIQAALLNRPDTDETKIIFPLSVGEFSRTEFDPALTENRVSERDIDRVIEEVHSQPNFRIRQPWIIYIIPFIMIAFFIAMFLILFTQASDLAGTSVLVIPVLMFGGMFVVLTVIIAIFCCAQSSAQKRLNQREKEIKAVLSKYNRVWSSKEVSWRVGTLGAWLQLDLDFVVRDMQGNLMTTRGGKSVLAGVKPVYPLAGPIRRVREGRL